MSGNTWIIIGVISSAIAAFSIPYGFHLKGKDKPREGTQINRDYVAGNKVTAEGDYIAGDKIFNIGPTQEETIVKCTLFDNESCPLKFTAFSFDNPPPEGSENAGITWNENYSEARLLLKNSLKIIIENLSIKVEPETHIVNAIQITQIPDVTISPDRGPIDAMALVYKNDKGDKKSVRANFGIFDGGPIPGFKLFCPKLLPSAEIEIVIACVVINPFKNGKPPSSLFGKRRNPKWVSVYGQYSVISKTMETQYELKYEIPLSNEPSLKDCFNGVVFEDVYGIGEKFLDERKLAEAVNCYNKALILNPNSAEAHFALGASYHLMNKNTLAKEEWEATIKINPKHAPSYFNIGLLLKRKDPEKAFDKYRDAIDVDPNFVEAYYQWGLDLLNSGHFDEAITKFTEVTKRIKEKDDPLHLDALGMCGFALEKVGRKNDAIEKYNRIIMIAPNSEQAKKSRNSLLILKDDE